MSLRCCSASSTRRSSRSSPRWPPASRWVERGKFSPAAQTDELVRCSMPVDEGPCLPRCAMRRLAGAPREPAGRMRNAPRRLHGAHNTARASRSVEKQHRLFRPTIIPMSSGNALRHLAIGVRGVGIIRESGSRCECAALNGRADPGKPVRMPTRRTARYSQGGLTSRDPGPWIILAARPCDPGNVPRVSLRIFFLWPIR
jgi:hypothetical protein